MDFTAVLSFLAAAIGLTLMPGPDNLYVLTESLRRGAPRGVALSAGLASGVLVHTALAASGIALLLQQSPAALRWLCYAGAAYLLWLAYRTLREPAQNAVPTAGQGPAPPLGFWPSYGQGVLMNVLNPKVTLFFLALLPQFTRPDGWPRFQQMLFLGLLFMGQAFTLFALLALAAGRLRPQLESARFGKLTKSFKFLLLVALALGLVFYP